MYVASPLTVLQVTVRPCFLSKDLGSQASFLNNCSDSVTIVITNISRGIFGVIVPPSVRSLEAYIDIGERENYHRKMVSVPQYLTAHIKASPASFNVEIIKPPLEVILNKCSGQNKCSKSSLM